jgi:hypothetical protein
MTPHARGDNDGEVAEDGGRGCVTFFHHPGLFSFVSFAVGC